jgi:predicted ATPase
MLTELRFENFKSWKDTGVMRMAPLTGFFGTNSSGKTAILQFLLMLKQTVESNDQSQILNFGNEHSYVDLGIVRDFAHKHRLPETLSLHLRWQPNSNHLPILPIKASVAVGKSHNAPKVGIRKLANMAEFADLPISTEHQGELEINVSFDLDSEELKIAQLVYNYLPEGSDSVNSVGIRKRAESDQYQMMIQGDPLCRLSADERDLISDRVPTLTSFGPQMSSIKNVASSFVRSFVRTLQSVYYLGPIRDHPKRFYSWSGEKPQDVGRRGENTIAALLTARKQDPEIEVKIAHWLKVMGLIDDFKVDLIAPEQRLYQASVRIAPGGTYCPITDVGFGVSQILPVLVLCYYVPKGSTIIFEQPEIHLHPSAQQKLADVFIDVIKHRELQIIIESHSEHLLHRLQRRIAEEELAPEQAALYFCQMEQDGASSLTELELDPFGNIKNWPEDFFGDDMGDLVAMTDAAMRRQMVQEAS